MSELKPCPLCNADKPFRTVTPETGIQSGDNGYRMTIKCRECGCTITRWALKKAWAISSAESAWNRRAQPDNEPLSIEELRGMGYEWVWVERIGKYGDLPESLLKYVNGYGYVLAKHYKVKLCDICLLFDDYGKAWLAYRRKPEPEGGDHDAQR